MIQKRAEDVGLNELNEACLSLYQFFGNDVFDTKFLKFTIT